MIKSTLEKIRNFINNQQKDIYLFLIIFLACLLCFALGYLFCIYTHKQAPVFGRIGENQAFFKKSKAAISAVSTDKLY